MLICRLTVVLLILVVCISSPAEAAMQNKPTKPNIILIVSDDQGYADMGAYRHAAKDINTQNLDQLATRGTRYTNAYITAPVCSPSRAGLIMGCYQQRWGNYWYGQGGLSANRPTIPEALKKLGYVCGYVGKVHYGKPIRSTGREFPLRHGFDEFYGATGGRIHYLKHTQKDINAYGKAAKTMAVQQFWDGETKKDAPGFSTELFGQRACEFIQTHKDKPFYLQVAFNAVHNMTYQLPDEYLKKHHLPEFKDWDPKVEPYMNWYAKQVNPRLPAGRAYYLGQLYYMDQQVGRILKLLDQLKLRENTLIAFVSDNGGSISIYADNGPLAGSKYTLSEGGIRVPMAISWPKHLPANRLSRQLVSSMDMLPTFVEVAGGDPKALHCDGKSLLTEIRGQSTDVIHETLVWDTRHQYAVRHGDWKLLVTRNEKWQNHMMQMYNIPVTQGVKLFNLKTDIGETNDLYTQNPEKVEQLQKLYQQWKTKINQENKR